jgi:hypothetical protein
MQQVFTYYQRAKGMGGNLTGVPGWGRLVIGIAALPGLALAALSILMFVVSIIALLLLAVPAFRLVQAISGSPSGGFRSRGNGGPGGTQAPQGDVFTGEVITDAGIGGSGRRTVEAKVVGE